MRPQRLNQAEHRAGSRLKPMPSERSGDGQPIADGASGTSKGSFAKLMVKRVRHT